MTSIDEDYVLGHEDAELARLEHQAGFLDAFLRGGMNPTLGLRLDALLRAAGLSTPVVAGMTRAVRGETDGSRMLAGIVTTMLPLIVRTGVADEAEIDVDTLGERLAAEMVGSLVVPPTLVGAWAVTPR